MPVHVCQHPASKQPRMLAWQVPANAGRVHLHLSPSLPVCPPAACSPPLALSQRLIWPLACISGSSSWFSSEMYGSRTSPANKREHNENTSSARSAEAPPAQPELAGCWCCITPPSHPSSHHAAPRPSRSLRTSHRRAVCRAALPAQNERELISRDDLVLAVVDHSLRKSTTAQVPVLSRQASSH